MSSIRSYQKAFSGGEVSPELLGRIDDAKYQTGLALCENFIVRPQGSVMNRQGFAYVRAVKDSTKKTRLLPFVFNATQTLVIELGAGYFRFHTAGATLLYGTLSAWQTSTGYSVGSLASNGGHNYYCTVAHTSGTFATDLAANRWYQMPDTGEFELPNNYVEADLFDIHYVQSGDIMTLVHPSYPPKELRRYGATNWALSSISFGSPIAAPSGVTVSPRGIRESANVTFSTGVVAGYVNWAGHQLSIGDSITFETSGALPTGVSANTLYYVAAPQFLATYNDTTSLFTLYGTDVSLKEEMAVVFLAQGAAGGPLTIGATYYIANWNGPGLGFNLSNTPGGTYIVGLGGGTWVDTFAVVDLDYARFVISATQGGSPLTITGAGTGTHTAHANASYSYSYVVTSVSSDGFSESAASSVVSIYNNLFQSGAYNSISWSSVSGASAYNVYKYQGGLYGFIGQTTGTSLVDNNIAPDMSKVPPQYETVFNATGNYPAAVGYFEQRRVFAGTNNAPSQVWMTQSGTESSMSYSLPSRDDDRVSFRVAARESNIIRHVVPLNQLVLMTNAAEWRVSPINSDAITPASISVRPQSYVGANNVQPVIVNNTLIYGAARGGHVREMAYNYQANGFVTGDLCIRAPHLFDGLSVTDLAFSKSPESLLWFISSNGLLLGLTYVPEQQIAAWHKHSTDGLFESVACVAEGDEDVLYAIVKRTIDGNTVRYVERMATGRLDVAREDGFFVDCGLTYDGTAATTISGLDHLEGEEVAILADGCVVPRQTVTNGEITLTQAAELVHIGLPIQANLQTLPLAAQIDNGFGMGRVKNLHSATVRVYQSGSLYLGPDADNLTEAKWRTTELIGDPPGLRTGEIEAYVTPKWAGSGQLYIRQSDPLPLTVVSVTLDVSIGH